MNISNPFIKKALDKFSVVEYKKSLIESLNPNLKETKDYQVIILAAGKGSRMNIDYPKTLHKLPYPKGEVCIFQNLLEGLDNLKSQTTIKDIKVVINKESKGFFQSLEESVKFKIIELNDSQIRGTAVCINEIKKDIKKNQEIIILWGDLALWRVSDLCLTTKIYEQSNSDFCFPTRLIDSPYVAFLRSRESNSLSIVHSNEEERHQGFAEQDCLSFVCSYDSLSWLEEFLTSSPRDTEVDFIRYIPYLISKGLKVNAIPIVENDHVFSLNTSEGEIKLKELISDMTIDQYQKIFLNPDYTKRL